MHQSFASTAQCSTTLGNFADDISWLSPHSQSNVMFVPFPFIAKKSER
jgi:hypothetical protein